MSTGDSAIRQNPVTNEDERLSFSDLVSPAHSSFWLAAQPIFDGSAVLNGGTTTTRPFTGNPPAAIGGFDGRSVLGIGTSPAQSPNVYDGRTPPSGAPYNGNHVFFQARPDWHGTQPAPPAQPEVPGYTGGQPGYTGGPMDPGLRQSAPPPDAPMYPRPQHPAAPPLSRPQITEVGNDSSKLVEWGIIGGGGVFAYTQKDKWFPAPTLSDALPTEASAQVLAEPLKKYNMANVNYQEALESHFKPVTSFLSKVTPERAGQIESHALLISTHPDLTNERDALKKVFTASDRTELQKTFEAAAKGRPNFETQARDFFTETRRLTNWMNRVPEIGKLKDTPPVADDAIVNAMTGQNKIWANEYQAETTKLSDTMADRLRIQGEEFTSKYRLGNGIGWMIGAAAYDLWYDSNYYRDATPGGYTYFMDAVQMGLTMIPVTRRIGWAAKIAGIAATHLFGRALDAQAQGKA